MLGTRIIGSRNIGLWNIQSFVTFGNQKNMIQNYVHHRWLIQFRNNHSNNKKNIKQSEIESISKPTKTMIHPDYILNNQQGHDQSKVVQTIPETSIQGFIKKIKPFMSLARLDKPIGTWLLFLPCSWAICLFSSPPHLYYLVLFGLGSILLRGAGCTINDYLDRNVDKIVARTNKRPIASGIITKQQAIVFLFLQLGLGFLILIQFNWFSILLGASSLIFVGFYPLMKRIMNWPQLFLGFTFNWGILLGRNYMFISR
jgi:hypothetical protein